MLGAALLEQKHWVPLELDLQMVVSQPVWCWDPNSGPVKEQDSILLHSCLSSSCVGTLVVSRDLLAERRNILTPIEDLYPIRRILHLAFCPFHSTTGILQTMQNGVAWACHHFID